MVVSFIIKFIVLKFESKFKYKIFSDTHISIINKYINIMYIFIFVGISILSLVIYIKYGYNDNIIDFYNCSIKFKDSGRRSLFYFYGTPVEYYHKFIGFIVVIYIGFLRNIYMVKNKN